MSSPPAAAGDEFDDFGSFTAAERLSDPYADVYGLPVDQPADAFVPATAVTTTTTGSRTSAGSPSLLSFSPVHGPALALNVSPRSLADPFADIVAASASASTVAPAAISAANTASLLSFSPLMGATTHEDSQRAGSGAAFSVPVMGLLSAGGDNAAASSATASSTSGLLLPPPRLSSSSMPAFASSTAAPSEPQPVVSDLLSFSPLAADSNPAPFVDVFGPIAASGTSSFDAGGGDELFAMTGALDAPVSARAADERATNSFSVAAPVSEFDLASLSDALPHVPASAPASLHGSFNVSSFAAAAPPLDEENDDWTDFVAADDAANEEATVEVGRDDHDQSARVWDTAPVTSGAFDALASSSTFITSPVQREPAPDASSSSLGAFDLPSPQSLGIEGASSASAELKPDIYFFSQGSNESARAENPKTEEQVGDQGFSSSDSEHKPETTPTNASSSADAGLDAFADSGTANITSEGLAESSNVNEEADLWGPLSPSSSSPSPASVEEKAPAVSSGISTPVGLGVADVSALDPFSSAGPSASNAAAPTSNDSSGGYYDLLTGTTTTPSSSIGFTSVATGDEDEFGDFSAGHDVVGFSISDGAADAFGDFAPVSLTPSSTPDDATDVFAQQSVAIVFDDGVNHEEVAVHAADDFEESKSELVNSFPETVVKSVDPFGAIDHSNDAFPSDTVDSESSGGFNASSSGADLKSDNGDDAFGDFGLGPSSPEHPDENLGVGDTFGSFAQSSIESDDAPIVASHDASDDFGDFAHSSGVSTTEDAHVTGGDNEFGDFAHTSGFSSSDNNVIADGDDDDFGGFAQSSDFSISANTNGGDDDVDGFGDFADSSIFASSATANANDDDDGFGDFAQSSAPSADAGDDFGDFADSSTFDNGGDDDFGDFSASSAPAPSTGADDDAFGDFSSPPTSVGESHGEAVAVSSFASDQELAAFFSGAFADVSVSVTINASTGNADEKFTSSYVVDSVVTPMTAGLVANIVNSAVESYVASAAATSEAKDGSDNLSRGNKLQDGTYIKYVLTEKIQEASQQNGIFPHGSEQHQSYLAIAAAGEPAKMREALKSLQDELFHKSVNDAMMRIARQAALSAKAKIAEQAAQQQANAKGSLLATTRQLLLSRNGGGSNSGGSASGSHDRDRSAAAAAVGGGSLGVLTPTGASVHKHSRFSFGHEDASSTSGGDVKSDVPKRRHSGSSEADISHGSSASTGASRTNSFGGTSSSGVASGTGSASSNGGLMKKFQDRFSSFSSSRHHNKTRVVSLRRMGQSGEDVRAMEINMDSISGGLDEVKWKCARFLYDVEEVSHVAPAQIRILSYPGNQVLSSKSDRSALVKFLKPGAIWTIDIGASNNDMLNEW